MSARYPSESVSPGPLGQSITFAFSGRKAPTRFFKGAMSEHLASWSPNEPHLRGIPSPNLVNAFRHWGETGALGVIVSGNIMLEYDELEAPGNPIISMKEEAKEGDERFEKFKEMAQVAKANGSLFVGQLSHPGRQVHDGIQPHPISASDVKLEAEFNGLTFAKPRPATQEDIQHVIESFAHAAAYLEAAGFDGVQLHGAHGFLFAQFLALTTNRRTDQYGGSLENRARLIVEVAQAIRRVTKPSFILGIKINSAEWQQGGFQPEEAKELCRILEENAFDFVELSGGTYEQFGFHHKRESTKKREAFFIEFAERITPGLSKTKVYVTGGFKTVGAMVNALNTVDGIGLGRPLAQEPRLPADILAGRVQGAIAQKFDQDDFQLAIVAAGTQIKQLGKDEEPVDLSVQENMDGFLNDMRAWTERLSKDAEMKEYEYMDLTAIAVPYGAGQVTV